MNSTTNTDLILGTAGHIDHGKSSLVKALTGVDPDRLKEEKKRGITIELGFAQLELDENTRLGVVDVPGHERFVRQMIAGATGIDVALFCIAADDGIMPQTVEHKAILELLSIPSCVVALTKSDLVDDEWLELITQEIKGFLSDSPFANAAIIPVSSHTGEGIDALKQEIMSLARTSQRIKEGDAARLPIDRVFTIKGSGTVVTGTLWSGSLAVDEDVEILPRGIKARVRSIQMHGNSVDRAVAGNRVAVNLNAVKTSDLTPGDFLTTSSELTSSDRFDAFFTYLDTSKSGKPLKSGARVHISHGTREVVGRILFMNGKELLKPGESTFVQLRTEEPLPLSWRDRFIVRAYSPIYVIGGGKVLLNHPRHRTTIGSSELQLLEALNQEHEADICRIAFEMQGHPVTAHELAQFCGLDTASVEKQLSFLQDSQSALVIEVEGKPPYYLTKGVRQKYLALIENTLLRFHAENPQQTGITKAAFLQLCDYRASSASFDALMQEAQLEKKIAINNGEISHPQAGGGAKKLEEDLAESFFTQLQAAGSKPPFVPELISGSDAESSVAYRALGSLEKAGRIRRVSSELYFSAEALDKLETALRNYLTQHEQATVSELKDAMESSRKYAVPLVEYFDDQGITYRDGDVRRLRSAASNSTP